MGTEFYTGSREEEEEEEERGQPWERAERGPLLLGEPAVQQGSGGQVRGCSSALTVALLCPQRAVEALEHEKRGLQGQIAQVLEGRQQLAHLKMSLSLEVATYRYGPDTPVTHTHMRGEDPG